MRVNATLVRILRKHLNSLAQMWSAFSFSNLSPNTHTPDINIEHSYLIYRIITRVDLDVGAYISKEITSIADGYLGKLGLPAFVAALCKE